MRAVSAAAHPGARWEPCRWDPPPGPEAWRWCPGPPADATFPPTRVSELATSRALLPARRPQRLTQPSLADGAGAGVCGPGGGQAGGARWGVVWEGCSGTGRSVWRRGCWGSQGSGYRSLWEPAGLPARGLQGQRIPWASPFAYRAEGALPQTPGSWFVCGSRPPWLLSASRRPSGTSAVTRSGDTPSSETREGLLGRRRARSWVWDMGVSW